jgi:capsular exopolysaccharide synthesis family protein
MKIAYKSINQNFFTEVSLNSLAKKIFRMKYLILASLITCLGLAYLYIKWAMPVYKVSTTYLVDTSGKSRSLGESQYMQGGVGMIETEKNIYNEMGILKSFGLIKGALEELDFGVSYYSSQFLSKREHYGYFPFQVQLADSSAQMYGSPFYIKILSDRTFNLQVKAKNFYVSNPANHTTHLVESSFRFSQDFEFGQDIKHHYFHFTVNKPDYNVAPEDFKGKKLYFHINSLDGLAKRYMAFIKVEQTDIQSSILRLETKGPVVEKEIKFLKKLSEKYVQGKLESREEIAASKENFIRKQLQSVADSLALAEVRLEAFKRGAQAVNLQQTATTTLDQLQKLETDRGQIELNMKYYNSLLNYIGNDSSLHKVIAPSVVGINDPLLNENLLELKRLNTEKTRLNFYKGSKSYDLELVDKQISATTNALQENVRNLIASSQMAMGANDKRIASLEQTINQLPGSEKQLITYERKSILYGNLYNYLSQELARAGIARAEDIADVQVLDEAQMVGNGPVAPQKELIMLLGLLVGLAFPLGWALFSTPDDKTIEDRQLLETQLDMPVLGSIAHFSSRTRLFSSALSNWHVVESFRDVSASLQLMITNPGKNVIGMTSIVPGEGKTFCAMNLAFSLASGAQRTLLIDCDLRKPSLLKENESANLIGLSNYLRGEVDDISQIIRPHPELPELSYLPTQVDERNPPRLLSGEKFRELIEQVRSKYDYVIVDAPAVGIVSDYLLISKYIDHHLFVVRRNYTKVSHLVEINGLRKKGRMDHAYFIFNDVTVDHFKYGYGYGHGKYGYGKPKELGQVIHYLPQAK